MTVMVTPEDIFELPAELRRDRDARQALDRGATVVDVIYASASHSLRDYSLLRESDSHVQALAVLDAHVDVHAYLQLRELLSADDARQELEDLEGRGLSPQGYAILRQISEPDQARELLTHLEYDPLASYDVQARYARARVAGATHEECMFVEKRHDISSYTLAREGGASHEEFLAACADPEVEDVSLYAYHRFCGATAQEARESLTSTNRDYGRSRQVGATHEEAMSIRDDEEDSSYGYCLIRSYGATHTEYLEVISLYPGRTGFPDAYTMSRAATLCHVHALAFAEDHTSSGLLPRGEGPQECMRCAQPALSDQEILDITWSYIRDYDL